MPKVKVQNAEIYYEVHGEGHPVIFIHGGGGNTMAWFQQVPFFSKMYKVITVDSRGFKYSSCDPGFFHPRYFPDDMLSLLDAEQLEKAAFVCQSLGAWAGLPLAVRAPERVSCLYINGSPTPAYSEENWRVLERGNSIFMGSAHDRESGVGWNRKTLETNPEKVFLYGQIKSLNPAPRFNSITMLDDVVKLYPEDFKNYQTPTMISGGAHDDFLNPTSHIHTATLIPGCTTYTFPDAGHSAYFETPQQFNQIVSLFLKNHIRD